MFFGHTLDSGRCCGPSGLMINPVAALPNLRGGSPRTGLMPNLPVKCCCVAAAFTLSQAHVPSAVTSLPPSRCVCVWRAAAAAPPLTSSRVEGARRQMPGLKVDRGDERMNVIAASSSPPLDPGAQPPPGALLHHWLGGGSTRPTSTPPPPRNVNAV